MVCPPWMFGDFFLLTWRVYLSLLLIHLSSPRLSVPSFFARQMRAFCETINRPFHVRYLEDEERIAVDRAVHRKEKEVLDKIEYESY